MNEIITMDEITAARRRGANVVLETPTLPSTSFSRLADADVWLKAENLQRTGSFKIRGAMNAIALLSEEARDRGVVAASAGNHAQGVALAATELGSKATVFMPESAALPKIAATKAYGAEVIFAGENLAESTDHAVKFAERTGSTLIHPFDDPNVVAGQGTLGLELYEQVQDIDTVVIPVGGGGLISGAATALRQLDSDIRIIGVQSKAVPTYVQARRSGVPTEIVPKPTIADGIAVSRPSEMCFTIIEDLVDDLVTVDDHEATEAVALLLERAKYLVEPSGAVGMAAVMNGQISGTGRTVVVLSGGNIDLLLLDGVVRHGLEARGRFGSLLITVPDEPGHLAEVLSLVGDRGGNILSIEHHRQEAGVSFGRVAIQLSLETRSSGHFGDIVRALDPYEVVATQLGRGSGSPS